MEVGREKAPRLSVMEKILVTLSTGAASIAVLAVLFTVPSLYNTINEVHDQVVTFFL